ncbi:DUF927 domain-containing protein [Turicibacter sanguinis]|nr:DUF927 domain-containing protein [Turicibacter sanguinis]MTP47957.1 DUF927 domain-containing protein [Turicibacter sanguinis]MTP50705.1 DUF927 domain-containing protein [Turicibacter sanguinis]MTQ07941.1 DUF927 domain-containing protein [Turicibacter sanguinis]
MNTCFKKYPSPDCPEVLFDEIDESENKRKFKTKTSNKIGNHIGVKSVKTNIETGESKAILDFAHIAGGRIVEQEVSLDKALSASKLESLSLYGMDVNTLNKNQVLKQIRNSISHIQESFIHSDMGFSYYNDQLIFKHYRLLGGKLQKNSIYDGEYGIEPKGSLKNWLDMFNREVKGCIPLELAVIFGLAAPVVGLIGDIVNVNSQLIHLVGNSSTGKTTALQLAVSTFGSPQISPKSLILTYNSTQNSLIKKLSGNTGVPMAIDEASMVPTRDWTDYLYIVTSGEDKGRLTKDLKLVGQSSFRTVVLSSGEYSIVSKAASNIGIHGRVLEFSGIKWTKDSANSNSIKDTCNKNYGHIGPMFVLHLMNIRQELLIKSYHKWNQKIQGLLKPTQIRDRLAQTLSIYMLVTYIAKSKLGLDFNEKEILDFLVRNTNDKATEFDIAIKAYEYIKEVVAKNPHHFTIMIEGNDKKEFVTKTECWGYVEKRFSETSSDEKIIRIGIAIEQLKVLLEKDNQFQSKEVVVKAWGDKEWLITEKDRNSKRVVITENSKGTACYVLDIPKIETELYGDD